MPALWSVRLIRRLSSIVAAAPKAPASAMAAAGSNAAAPGRRTTRTPTRPTRTAIVRRQPTCSPSIGTDNMVTNSGIAKPIDRRLGQRQHGEGMEERQRRADADDATQNVQAGVAGAQQARPAGARQEDRDRHEREQAAEEQQLRHRVVGGQPLDQRIHDREQRDRQRREDDAARPGW